MRKAILLFFIAALSCVTARAQFIPGPPAKAAYCLNPSGNWIPILQGASGSTLPNSPPASAMYGLSGSTWYALACDANGNLIVSPSGFGTQTANTFLAGPGSGPAAIPTFRAITPGDVPTLNQNTTGNAATATNVAFSGLTGLNPQTTTPAWLQFLGNGADGSETCNGNLSGEYYYTNFVIATSTTCTVNSANGLTIHATGTCTINGSIVTAAASSITDPAGGGTGAGGGGGAASGSTGSGTYPSPGASGYLLQAGGSGGTAGNTGSGGNNIVSTYSRAITNSGPNDTILFGGGTGGAGGSTGGAGGYGGAHVTLICGSITGTGTITANGGNGTAAAANSTGGGGGGGGGIIILSSQAAETYGLTLSVAGGSGGGCGIYTSCGAGGTGGNGFTAEFSGW